MGRREALASLISALGWEPEADTTSGLISQLSRMVQVTDGGLSVKEAPSYVAKVGKRGYESIDDAIAAGGTVRLLKDLTKGITIPKGASVRLNLNGHSIITSGKAITNNGALVISGTGVVKSTDDCAIIATTDSLTVIESGTYESVEGAVITGRNTNATINISGGTFSATDNAVLAGNGTKGFGSNTFNVSGGTFTGGITSDGYVACGIYAPNDNTVNVTGGVFNVTGGCGVCARAGKTTVTGGEFNVTGSVTGKVGDSRIVVPCSVFVFDTDAKYPALSDDDGLTVRGGSFKSEADAITCVGDTRISVYAGTFDKPVDEKYCAAGLKPKQNADGTYTVGR